MPIEEKYMFSKLYTPVKENHGRVLTIGVLPEDLRKLRPNKHYIIKFYELEIKG